MLFFVASIKKMHFIWIILYTEFGIILGIVLLIMPRIKRKKRKGSHGVKARENHRITVVEDTSVSEI